MQDRDKESQSRVEKTEDRSDEAQHPTDDRGEGTSDGAHLSPVQETGENEIDEDRRPTPVRVVMEGGDEEDSEKETKSRVIHEGEDGPEWIVTVSGRSVSGVLPLRTVPLMELSFAHAGAPDQPLRRALRYGATLAEITDQELLDSLRQSEPFREPKRTSQNPESKGRKGRNRRSQKK